MAAPETVATPSVPSAIALEAQRVCQHLLRIDTTNPPGAERACAEYLAGEMAEVGLECQLLEAEPGRTNMVTRLRGDGSAPPLLLTAHLDVVEADETKWEHPPFGGVIADGCLWGRGAIDMKNMAAMITAIVRKLARDGTKLKRDVIFAAVADEEAGCDLGSRFLVEEHRSLIESEYVVGEGGGFSLHLGDTTFYPVQVAEKGFCWVRARITAEPGHGSMPRPDSAVVKLGEALASLGKAQLPVHSTTYMREFLARVAARQPAIARPLLRLLAKPELVARLTRFLPGSSVARGLGALLSNTASPTVVRAGAKTNVIPGVAEFEIDGRTLPGQSDEAFLAELRAVMGPGVELEIMKSAPPIETKPMASPLYDIITRQVLAREPHAEVVPYMIPGFTDAKYFTQMGARWYGFSPVKIERDSGIRFADMFHGHNERVPLAGLHWGTDLLDAIVRELCT